MSETGRQESAMRSGVVQQISRLREAAASSDRDANAEFPGSYYRKAHRARARRLRARADSLQASLAEDRQAWIEELGYDG